MSIKIENASVYGIVRAVYSARNAMNSWNNSDSNFETGTLGENDLRLAKKLVKAGTDHSKFMRFITVTADITAPLYWWKEYDTYKVGTVTNSCSTMHTIHKKPFELDDFSNEHLYVRSLALFVEQIIPALNYWRDRFIATNNKNCWWQMIQLLPQSYNQKRTVMLNYQVLRNMYHARKNHKLDCWIHFCKWIETLPYAKELICDVG